jgi:hypothetical protein
MDPVNAPLIASLRWSLLASIGIVPLACGGNTDQRANMSTGGTATVGEGGTNATTAGRPAIGGSNATTAGRGPTSITCTSPQVDPSTQLLGCEEGYVHRPAATVCTPPAGGPSAGGADGAGDPPAGGIGGRLPSATGRELCATSGVPDDALCAGFQHGFCRTVVPSIECRGGCCFSGCVSDQDCGTGSICLCGSTRSPTGGECVAADCATDRDCGEGFLCASHDDVCGTDGRPRFGCQKLEDECTTSADCAGRPCSVGANGNPFRECFTGACGRPFLIAAEPRMAPLVDSAEWVENGPRRPRVEHLTFAERTALADHWKKMGQMEHASIAAFARFSLQLLSLGAPPELLEACTQALADETAHTKLCFQLASAYAGCAVGPGALDIDGSLAVTSLADVVELVISEGCFGETAAALDAFDAASTATDPVIARAYAEIAADEQRHAELAFRFVRWALARGGAVVAGRIAASIAAPPASHRAACAVTLPCLSALLSSRS